MPNAAHVDVESRRVEGAANPINEFVGKGESFNREVQK